MPYRRDLAVQTVLSVLAALKEGWAQLGADAREALCRIVDEGGHDLYRANALNRATSCVRILDGIATLPDLPLTVTKELTAGAGIATVALVRVTDEERDRVLDALARVYDARRYADPWALASELHGRISRAKGQLDADTRRRWEVLDAAGGDPVKYLDQLVPLLGDRLPFVREAIDAGKTWEPTHLSAARPPTAARDGFGPPDNSDAGFDSLTLGVPKGLTPEGPPPSAQTAPARVQRSANVYFPDTLQLGQKRVPLIVHIARKAAEGTVTVKQGSSEVTLTVGDVIISVLAPDFDVDSAIGGAEVPGVPYLRRVNVDPSSNSEPVIFFLSPTEGCEAGTKRISIEFLQKNKRQGSLAFDVEVVEEPVPATRLGSIVRSGFPIAPHVLTADAEVNAADLDLRVCLQGNTLSFSLWCIDGRYQELKLGQKTLGQGAPKAYFTSMTDQLSVLAAQSPDDEDDDPEQRKKAEARNVARLQALGVSLWDDLIPDKLAELYDTDLRANFAGKSLVITSDEPWIPWEMVRPVKREGGRVVYIDPPLCEQFRLTRWLDGQAPPDQLEVKRGVIVAPEADLDFVKKELDYFSALTWTNAIRTLDQVNQEFDQGSAQLFHFSCHGQAGTDVAESSLLLGDESLAPRDMLGRSVKLYQCTPLVFLNACEAGRPNFTVTGVGGWACAFIKLQASIFIGALWAINDQLAAEFAVSFYNRLWGLNGQVQQSVGEAFHAARQELKARAPGNPTWLAYVLYGDPNGRVYIKA